MRKILWSLLPLILCSAQALAESPSLVDYLRTSPATVAGHVILEAPHKMYRSGGGLITSGIRKDKGVFFNFDERQISINSKDAIYVSMAGIPVNITDLSYDNQTGKIAVKTSVMGSKLQAKFIENKVRAEVEKQYLPKLKTAFGRLSNLRKRRTLGDANNVLKEVMQAFSGEAGKGPRLPSFRGEITLINPVAQDATVKLGDLNADFKKGDSLQSTLIFRKPSNAKMEVKGFTFMSTKGVVMREPKTSKDGIKTMKLSSLSLTEELGFQMEATNGGDDIYNGGQLVIGLFGMIQNQTGVMRDCHRFEALQQKINIQTHSELRAFIREHRGEILKAGATPQLIRAIESQRS